MNNRKTAQAALIDGIKRRVPNDQLSKLIADAEDINFQDADGRTPLHHAIIAGNKNAFHELIKLKANANTQDKIGNSPLHLAIIEMSDDLVPQLLTAGAETDIKNSDGDTALHLYAKGGPQRGIAVLDNNQRAFESSLYLPNNKGETPLHCAISSDNMYFFTYFVNTLQHRYYGQVNLRHPQLLGPNGDNLAHTAVRRLYHKDWPDNESRTYTILQFLAGTDPTLFSEKNRELVFGNTPLDILPSEASATIRELVKNPHLVYMLTFANKQMLGTLQQTLNRVSDENASLKSELTSLKADLSSVKNQLETVTQLLTQALATQAQQKQPPKAEAGSESPRLFRGPAAPGSN